MNSYLHQFLFGFYPYICAVVCVVGCLIRYDREQYSWKASSSQMLSNTKLFKIGNILFHVGLLLILAGHVVGLLMPESLYHHIISVEHKQLLAMIAGGIFGVICFIGLTILVLRRLFNPIVRITSKPSDILVLLMLYGQLILGLISIKVSMQHLDGSAMVALASWAQHIVTFRVGAADFIQDVDLIFKMHILLGMSIFLIFPFTRLVHFVSFPFGYVFRQGYQIVRSKEARK